ncbi:MAG: DUF445 domain-containing protein [Pseudomonadota bacterium]
MKPTTPLARMKNIALLLLIGAAGVYVLAASLEHRHPAWPYVAAFAEAAMVGAVADWFAVVALFRHPLGVPIPHTAIIPSNKDRIGENLAAFLCTHFLSTEQVLSKLKEFDVPARLAAWLSDPLHARQVGDHVGSLVGHALKAFDDEAVRHFFHTTVVERLTRLDASRLAGELLGLLTADGRHQPLLSRLLRQLAGLLDDDVLKETLSDVVATEVKYLRFVGLDAVAGRYATNKMVAGVAKLAADMSEDPHHPLRQRFDHFVAGFAQRLKDDPALRDQGAALWQELLAHPQLGHYLHGLWSDAIDWVRTDLSHPDSRVRERVGLAAQRLGEQLARDPAMQAWIQQQLTAGAPALIDRYREDIRRYIVGRVHEWNAAEMTRELENHIGRDLQFIRINGTLVGGLVGLGIHAVTEMARHLR